MIKNVIQATCDRCKTTKYYDPDSYEDAPENWLTLREIGENAEDIHLCDGCRVKFMLFKRNTTVPVSDKDYKPSTFGEDLFPKEFGDVTNG
jgi:hypothetical protein